MIDSSRYDWGLGLDRFGSSEICKNNKSRLKGWSWFTSLRKPLKMTSTSCRRVSLSLTKPCRGSKNVWSNQSSVVQVDNHKLFHPSWHWAKGPWWNKVGRSEYQIFTYDMTWQTMTCLQICTYIHINIVQVYVHKCINMICGLFFSKEMCHVTCNINVYRLNFDELKWAYITQHKTRELTPKMCCGSHQAIHHWVLQIKAWRYLKFSLPGFHRISSSLVPLDAQPPNHQILNFCDQNERKMNKSPGKIQRKVSLSILVVYKTNRLTTSEKYLLCRIWSYLIPTSNASFGWNWTGQIHSLKLA